MTEVSKLREIITEIDSKLDDKDTVRELVMKSSRTIERTSRQIIQLIHNDEEPRETFNEAFQEISKVKSIVEDYPELYNSGMLRNGFQELAEAHILWAIKSGDNIRTPKELGITAGSYVLGMGDVVGELRRMVLDNLAEGKLNDARKLLRLMEQIKDMLMIFDYPNAVLPVKHKQDIARDLVEKTRGDVTNALINTSLKNKMNDLFDSL